MATDHFIWPKTTNTVNCKLNCRKLFTLHIVRFFSITTIYKHPNAHNSHPVVICVKTYAYGSSMWPYAQYYTVYENNCTVHTAIRKFVRKYQFYGAYIIWYKHFKWVNEQIPNQIQRSNDPKWKTKQIIIHLVVYGCCQLQFRNQKCDSIWLWPNLI